ncbi:MAG: 3-phosphoserine/phosphohydroxythreonine transaminase [bacterium]|nr:3-phosphoserine/phosphohydroxythreonine transaminase [bacterium]
MKNKRPYNFNPGPAILPLEVMQKAQEEFLNFNNTGLSIAESSHRGKDFEGVVQQAQEKIKKILNISDEYNILFLQGGASLQFGMIPMNFLNGKNADYVLTGYWAKQAVKEAKLFGQVNIAASSEDKNFSVIPEKFNFSSDAQYVHLTSNETIHGIQWRKFPDTGNVPLIADMSSDIISRRFDMNKFSMIYAGTQKNMGTSGVTLVILRKDLAGKANPNLTTMLKYQTHIEKNSLYNTPCVIGIYLTNLVLDWVLKQGGLDAVEKMNNEKAAILYDYIDSSNFYYGLTEKTDRSKMNVVYQIKDAAAEEKFISEAKASGFIGLKGHRNLGHIRASIYNAMPLQGVKDLVSFMKDFAKKNG